MACYPRHSAVYIRYPDTMIDNQGHGNSQRSGDPGISHEAGLLTHNVCHIDPHVSTVDTATARRAEATEQEREQGSAQAPGK